MPDATTQVTQLQQQIDVLVPTGQERQVDGLWSSVRREHPSHAHRPPGLDGLDHRPQLRAPECSKRLRVYVPPPLPPCVESKRPRVHWHHARMRFNMCAWCRYTRGRFECTHGSVLNGHTGVFSVPQPQPQPQRHTPQTPHALPHTTSHNNTTRNTTRRQRQRETEKEDRERGRRENERRDKRREDKTKEKGRQDKTKEKRREKTRQDKRGEMEEEMILLNNVSNEKKTVR